MGAQPTCGKARQAGHHRAPAIPARHSVCPADGRARHIAALEALLESGHAVPRELGVPDEVVERDDDAVSLSQSLYVLQTTNSPPGRRPRVEIDQNTDLSLLSNTPQI
eukprot:COSAG05_NODE_372_length_10695_cov_5.301623_14_plen_108_part_00